MDGGVFIVAIGDELLDGRSADRNSHWLMRQLAALGAPVTGAEVVGDAQSAIVSALRRAAARHSTVLVTGGLGPTRDDRTRAALAEFAGLSLEPDPAVLATIRERFAARGKTMPPGNESQAMRPRGAVFVPNPVGTAPGILLEVGAVLFALMPGVPSEMRRMWQDEIASVVAARVSAGSSAQLRLRLARSGESAIAAQVESWLTAQPRFDVAYCVNDWGVDVLLRGEDRDELAAAAERLSQLLAPRVFGIGDASLPGLLLNALRRRGLRLAVAESCTGGLLAGAITEVPGSSDVFVGGVVAYADRIKSEWLGVDPAQLSKHGAVSEPVALALAEGARTRMGSDFALSTTGIAGPSGGTVQKPVGMVWIAVADASGAVAECLRLGDDREMNRRASVAAALDLLRLRLGSGRLDL